MDKVLKNKVKLFKQFIMMFNEKIQKIINVTTSTIISSLIEIINNDEFRKPL